MILAGVRAGQQTADPIRKYLDMNGLVTGRFVIMRRLKAEAGVITSTPGFHSVQRPEIRKAAMEQELGAPSIAVANQLVVKQAVQRTFPTPPVLAAMEIIGRSA